MYSIRKKKINKKEYNYIETSFRLPDGKVKKLSKFIREPEKPYGDDVSQYFLKKEIESYQNYALSRYKIDTIFNEDVLKKAEEIRVKYRHLKRYFKDKAMKDLIDRFTINFTYESNAIEGNSLTLKEVTMLLLNDLSPKDKKLREIFETRNSRIVTEMLFRGELKITLNDILKIHSLLMKDTGINLGFKSFPNYIAMSDLKTVPPEKAESEIIKLVNWYHREKERCHPVLLASEFHGRFEMIHPFEDGNGRCGRILINAILVDNDYPPLIIRKSVRMAYYRALDAFDKGHKMKLERFILEKFVATFEKFFEVYVKYV